MRISSCFSSATISGCLSAKSVGWHEGTNDYAPFVRYMLGGIVAAYGEFESRVDVTITKGLSKPERVAEIIKGTLGKITKRELVERCPDISDTTIQRTLNELLKNGEILKISGLRQSD